MAECLAKVLRYDFRQEIVVVFHTLFYSFSVSLSFLRMDTARACVDSTAQRETTRRYISNDLEVN